MTAEKSALEREAERLGAERTVPDGYNEVEVEFFQFKNVGDSIAGRLIEKHITTIQGNKCGKYAIVDQSNKRAVFLGSVQMDELLNTVAVGTEIYVEYIGQGATTEKGFQIKRFVVGTKPYKR